MSVLRDRIRSDSSTRRSRRRNTIFAVISFLTGKYQQVVSSHRFSYQATLFRQYRRNYFQYLIPKDLSIPCLPLANSPSLTYDKCTEKRSLICLLISGHLSGFHLPYNTVSPDQSDVPHHVFIPEFLGLVLLVITVNNQAIHPPMPPNISSRTADGHTSPIASQGSWILSFVQRTRLPSISLRIFIILHLKISCRTLCPNTDCHHQNKPANR